MLAALLLGCLACAEPGPPAISERYAAQRKLAAANATSSEFRTALAALETWHRKNRTAVASRLNPGLDPQQIRERTAGLEAPLPDELIELYAWHDGTAGGCDDFAGPALVGYHCFLSLDEAMARRLRDRDLYRVSKRWFPVLMHQEEYFYIVLEDLKTSAVPVFHRLLEDESRVSFINLQAMIETYVEAAQSAAWHPDDDARTRWGDVEAIRKRRNPVTDPPWAP